MTQGVTFPLFLPISRRAVTLRQPTGRDEILLTEGRGSEAGLAIALADGLAVGALDAATLAIPDLDTLLLRLRQMVIGDRVLAEILCRAEGCGARVDISFSITAYLAHHAPRAPRLRHCHVDRCPDVPGWFALRRPEGLELGRFRPPTAGDEREIAGRPDSAAMLTARCLAPSPFPLPLRRSAEAAMAALAPSLAGPLNGACPECGAAVIVQFDPRSYVLAELRTRAGFLAEEVDLLATRYHWTERSILNLPSQRRAAYAETARRAA